MATEEEKLRGVLTALIPKIEKLHVEKIPEATTRSNLIDPVLRELGWDVEDYAEVRQEDKAKPDFNPADYELMVRGRATILIEAN